jgi:hypothetical protein
LASVWNNKSDQSYQPFFEKLEKLRKLTTVATIIFFASVQNVRLSASPGAEFNRNETESCRLDPSILWGRLTLVARRSNSLFMLGHVARVRVRSPGCRTRWAIAIQRLDRCDWIFGYVSAF